jgi:hypothetical protein
MAYFRESAWARVPGRGFAILAQKTSETGLNPRAGEGKWHVPRSACAAQLRARHVLPENGTPLGSARKTATSEPPPLEADALTEWQRGRSAGVPG